MNEYKKVKEVMRQFVLDHLGLGGNQVFRAPPRATDITDYPVVIIRSATSQKVPLGGVEANNFTLLLGILTRGTTAEIASDELDGLLKTLDNKMVEVTWRGLDKSDMGDSRWTDFTRLGQTTTFDNAVEEDTGLVTYGATAAVLIQEATTTRVG